MSLPAHLTAGDLPATVSGAEIKKHQEPPVPQRKDYVPPIPKHQDWTEISMELLMKVHRFLEINAVYPEDKELAQQLREEIES